jgi:hypothetical protein
MMRAVKRVVQFFRIFSEQNRYSFLILHNFTFKYLLLIKSWRSNDTLCIRIRYLIINHLFTYKLHGCCYCAQLNASNCECKIDEQWMSNFFFKYYLEGNDWQCVDLLSRHSKLICPSSICLCLIHACTVDYTHVPKKRSWRYTTTKI